MIQRVMIPAIRADASPAATVRLLRGFERAWQLPGPIILDFSLCRILSPNAAALVAMLKLDRNRLGLRTSIDWRTVAVPVRRQLGRWRIGRLFGVEAYPWTETAIPLLHQPTSDSKALVGFVDAHVIPVFHMTAALAKETRGSFCEIFTNVFRHSESAIGGVAIGQVYPAAKRFELCVADKGVGLVNRVRSSGNGTGSAAEAFRWALAPGNSTRVGPEPPGLGLFLLQQFVTANGGVLKIFANRGWHTEVAGAITDGELEEEFPGTFIELRLYVRDHVTYDISYE